jgi:hypothetical protein
MTRIYKQCRNISESFIFVRENILKSDLIYLLRQYQSCYVFMFFLSVQAFFTLDRFGQQADGNITPGGMFFMFLVPIICQCIPGRHPPFLIYRHFFLSVPRHFWCPFPCFVQEIFVC